jgi:7,8-dihydropterin-6-yl-methyl-4-(beta-D-ribofuranosyl)aminobenzene 5'-phosphate synthase
VTVLYDNMAAAPGTKADWGFSCLIQGFDRTVLFDTGADGEILLHNMEVLGVDPLDIDAVVLSHEHSDHTGGLEAIRATNPALIVYPPASSSTAVSPGLIMTAALGDDPAEAGIVVETEQGPILITGCAHPGIVEMTEAAAALTGRPVVGVMGGFHLSSASEAQLDRIVHDLKALGVTRCGPAHCTGEMATARMKAAFGAGFIQMGVGAMVTF